MKLSDRSRSMNNTREEIDIAVRKFHSIKAGDDENAALAALVTLERLGVNSEILEGMFALIAR